MALGDPLSGALDNALSVSQSYQSRSVFSNPAALGYQTELNGIGVATSLIYGGSRQPLNEYSLGLSVGWLGFGAEELAEATGGKLNRYGISLGFPLLNPVYFGVRFNFLRSDAFGSYATQDIGMQFRASKHVSFGFLANRVNQPTVGGTRLPMQLVAGVTLRPVESVELMADVDSTVTSFGKPLGYQINLAVEPTTGLRLRVGYHKDQQWLLGAQVNFGAASFFASFQPSRAAHRNFMLGLQISSTPLRSALQPPTTLRVTIDDTLDEEGRRGGLFLSGRPSLLGILRLLDEARRQDHVREVLVRIETFPLGLAAAQDVHEALWKLREAGKRVEVFLSHGSMDEYLIASAANRITLAGEAELRFLGFRSQRYFLKGTLDKIGVEGELLARGEYKSAPETFTRKESSPVNRAASLELLQSAETAYRALLKRARGIDETAWKAMLEHAIYGAEDALAAKLIDAVGDFADATEKRINPRENLISQSERLALPSRVAVIVAAGSILPKRMRLLSLSGERQVTPERMEKLFKAAASDPRIKAIVLRVSSPGGEILASHEIGNLVERTRKEKPVIVTMGDVAASGGYYISAPADRIFARPLTLTGSIGVFLGKPNLRGLFGKIDLHKEILSLAPHAGLESEDRPWTKEDRAVMQRRLDQFYLGFTKYVASRRHLSLEVVENAAKGRVWLGEAALAKKLVDEEGGYLEAVRYAATKADLDDGDYETVLLSPSAGLFDFFGEDGFPGMASASAGIAELPMSLLGRDALRELAWIASLRETPFLYLAPESLSY